MSLNRGAALRSAGIDDNVTSLWGPADMSVLSAGRRAAPSMPPELFGDMWPLLQDLAEAAGAPVDYVGMSLLAIGASLIGAKRWVKPYDVGPWKEPAILWCALIGDPSRGKSPVIDILKEPLKALEVEHAGAHQRALMEHEGSVERAKAERAAWQDMVKAAASDKLATPPLPDAAVVPNAPERRRLYVMDATPEALGTILAGNPAGTLSLRDELSAWFVSFDRYNPGGRPFFLEAYGGRSYIVDRKSREGSIQIDHFSVSILGGIQPAKLADCLFDAPDDGLASRFLWTWPESLPYNPPSAPADMAALANLYRRLDGLQWGLGEEGKDVLVTLPLDPAAKAMLVEWIRANEAGMEDHSALYQGLVGKMRGGVLRLALVAEMLGWAWRGGTEPKCVSKQTLVHALDFVDEYVKPMALRVFGDAALPPVDRNAAVLARYIRKAKLSRINARELKNSPHKQFLPGMRQKETLNDALDLLVDAGLLKEAPSRDGDRPGQPRRDYLVNPVLLGGG